VLGLAAEAEPAQQRPTQRERATDLDDFVSQEVDRRL
jgi:hypothetical protein